MATGWHLVVCVLEVSIYSMTTALFALWSWHTGTGSRIKSMLVGFVGPVWVPVKFVEICGLWDGVSVVWALIYFSIYSHRLRLCSLVKLPRRNRSRIKSLWVGFNRRVCTFRIRHEIWSTGWRFGCMRVDLFPYIPIGLRLCRFVKLPHRNRQ